MTRRLAAEFLGTAGLLLAVVGSGITAAADGAASAQLFQHAAVVGVSLAALIVTLGPVSGAHFNPAVTLVDAVFGGLAARTAVAYVVAQTIGAVAGVVGANLLFGLPAVELATTERAGLAQAGSEAVATFGLLLVIFGVVRSGRTGAVPAAVGAWVGGAIYFTPSASFANPAVTVARALTDTYTGIDPADVPLFVLAQVVGAAVAAAAVALLFRPGPSTAADVVVPHPLTDDENEEGVMVSDKPSVLFLCVHNAGRSQMAAGWLRHLAGDRVEVMSGGSAPAEQVNPAAVASMREVGVDIAGEHPKPWTEETLGAADVVVTMGCGDACPVYPGKRYVDWQLDDPAGKEVADVRPIRDDIERRVRGLLDELGVTAVE